MPWPIAPADEFMGVWIPGYVFRLAMPLNNDLPSVVCDGVRLISFACVIYF
jgi:hypothetical protein